MVKSLVRILLKSDLFFCYFVFVCAIGVYQRESIFCFCIIVYELSLWVYLNEIQKVGNILLSLKNLLISILNVAKIVLEVFCDFDSDI